MNQILKGKMATNKSKGTVTILGIETSCDETAASVLTGKLASNKPSFIIKSSVVKSQIPLHRKTGGVVPEVAARAHLQNIMPAVSLALEQADVSLDGLDYIAVTSGPGLVVSLVVGVEFAKGLAYASGVPLLPTNHMAGHLYSAFGGDAKIQFPALAVVVSGGHTMLLLMKDYYHFKVIGNTVDDAVGEAFDKVARVLGLPYPGGPEISKLALQGSESINFPRPMLNQKNYDFSFSGLKTAVANYIKAQKRLTPKLKADIAHSFEQAAVDVLAQKALRAAKQYGCKTIALAGGVAANLVLRARLESDAEANRMTFTVPPFALCTDNAAMIAMAAYFNLRGGAKLARLDKVKADPAWELK